MHYTAAITSFLVAPRRVARPAEDVAPLPSMKVGAWRNWWNMTVEEPPGIHARQTRAVGARGRLVVPPR